MTNWRSTRIEPGVLTAWADEDVFNKWGLKGAARVVVIPGADGMLSAAA